MAESQLCRMRRAIGHWPQCSIDLRVTGAAKSGTVTLIGQRSSVISMSVCLSLSLSLCVCVCVCLPVRDHIFGTTRPIFSKFFVHGTYGRVSVFLWLRRDMLRISGFVDDVTFARKLVDAAARLRQ